MTYPAAFWLGLAVLPVAWIYSAAQATHSFTTHMAVHMSIVAVAAPLLAIGIGGSEWDPVRRWPAALSPLAASLVEFIVVWLWHMPKLHEATRHGFLVVATEQVSFLLAGFFLWMSVLGGDQNQRMERGATGIVALLLTLIHMTLLGALLALSPRVLYAHAHSGSPLSVLDDQQMGGAIMLVVGGISYLSGGLWLTVRLLAARPARRA